MNTMRALVLALVLAATSASAADAPGAGLYTTEIEGTVQAGKDGKITLKIVPAKGYKWNKEYPRSFVKLSSGDKVVFTKAEYRMDKGDFADSDKAGTVAIQARGKAAGEEIVKADAEFSVCNDEQCKVLKNIKLKMKITVK